MRALTTILAASAVGLGARLIFVRKAAAPPAVILSRAYTIDRVYRSMTGPFETVPVRLLNAGPPERLWITGIRTEIVDSDGVAHQPKEFMCHVNLDLPLGTERTLFAWTPAAEKRLFTVSQGQFEIRFPPGFGLPVMSDTELSLTTQVLNNNPQTRKFKVRHKVAIDYVRDRDLASPMKPLMEKSTFVLALLQGHDGFYSQKAPAGETLHSSCLPGAPARGGDKNRYSDQYGRTLTGHWVVKPGREVRHTVVTKQLGLGYDTTLHYAAAHLHPFAESLELRDLTAGKTVFKAGARPSPRGVGIDHVDHFSSAAGIALYRSHEYELVSVYNNTSGVDQDSMAVMSLYLLNKNLHSRSAR